jgi:hypothetical protein
MQHRVPHDAHSAEVPASIHVGLHERIVELRRVIDNYRRARLSVPQSAWAALELRMHFAARELAHLERLLPPAPQDDGSFSPAPTAKGRSKEAGHC